jgi:hypothetical protein
VGLNEIKYFENEMTNFETKMIALVGARQQGDHATLAKIYIDLAATERNFVLKKGESTVALRRDEIDQSHYENLANTLVGLVKGRLNSEQQEKTNEKHPRNRTKV